MRVFCLRAVCTKNMDNLSEVKSLPNSEYLWRPVLSWAGVRMEDPSLHQPMLSVSLLYSGLSVLRYTLSWNLLLVLPCLVCIYQCNSSHKLQGFSVACVTLASITSSLLCSQQQGKTPHWSLTMPQLVGWGATITGNVPEHICAVGLGKLNFYSLCMRITFR